MQISEENGIVPPLFTHFSLLDHDVVKFCSPIGLVKGNVEKIEGALSVTTVWSIISNYCVGYSMGCKDYSQFLNSFSGSNKVHKMDISPLKCASTRTKKM